MSATFLLVSRTFSNHRGLALGFYGVSATFGTMSMPLIQNFLLENFSIRGTVLISGGLASHLLVGSALLLRSRQSQQQFKGNE